MSKSLCVIYRCLTESVSGLAGVLDVSLEEGQEVCKIHVEMFV